MNIKTLNLIAFGKFKNKNIEFEPGLNLVYGDNESGKSTIHQFIEGMFFGFFQPYRKKKSYSAAYEKYKPWTGEEYSGQLIYEDKSGEHTLQRQFLKSKESLEIFSTATGEEISEEFPYNKVTKQALPLKKIDVSQQEFKNTVSIKQLSSQTDEKLAEEVRERLIQGNETQQQHLSINGILKYLNDKKEAYGTVKRKGSPLGIATLKLAALKEELEDSEKSYISMIEKQQELHQLKGELEKLNNELDTLNQKREDKKAREIVDKYNTVQEKQQELVKISREIENLKPYEMYSDEIYEEMYDSVKTLKTLKIQEEALEQALTEQEKKKKNLEEVIEKIPSEVWENTPIQIQQDVDDYLEHEGAIQEMNEEVIDEETLMTNSKVSPVFLILAIISVLGSCGLLFYDQFQWTLFSYIGAGLGTMALLFIIAHITSVIRLKKAKETRQLYLDKVDEVKGKVGIHQEIMDDILEKYNKNSKEELTETLALSKHIEGKISKAKIQVALNKSELDKLDTEIIVCSENTEKVKEHINFLLEKESVASITDYKAGLEKRQEYENLVEKQSQIKEIINTYLGSDTMETLEDRYRPYAEMEMTEDSMINTDYDEEIAQKNATLLEKSERVVALDTEIAGLQADYRIPVDIQEEILEVTEETEGLTAEIDSLELSINEYENILKAIHFESAPELNERISDVLSFITGKYNEVKVNEELEIKIKDPDTGYYIDVENLSDGTIDQLYFSLRFGISSLIQDKEDLPLILDESFIQYDRRRLIRVVKFLEELAKTRQVILLTCREVERSVFKEQNIDYNEIRL
jgi:uncharacterized protein YhaN